ncbi:DUF3343 domain-containing protein [Coriobacteriia bacterium Es71-Z0120]|uniref:DUF3343 domain-containing protein n=1 Tax=Parvivirga hydrogeniphila TaxID=2939460 RepID=UPI002260A03B|nr:DUF3343 domain-containing protein [Parvivirga hydrogeniphila]MCL4078043.1 DUF3343 domain-containing protein [Parvivirga hydrogeniphila]
MLFRKKDRREAPDAHEASGLFLFDQVPDALWAERVLKRAGYDYALVAPPHHLRAGCDLAVAVPRVEHVGAERLLRESGVPVRGWVDDPGSSAAPVDLVTTVDFGDHLMVRAGNMKIVVDKNTLVIVNTSGGGCPDIPYLNVELVGRRLDEAPRPKSLGYTLCGLMLDRAYEEACALLGVEPA